MIAVIDYCKGNLKSVERGLTHVGGDAHITDDPEVIHTADALVLPGVGSFADASATMQQTGQMLSLIHIYQRLIAPSVGKQPHRLLGRSSILLESPGAIFRDIS